MIQVFGYICALRSKFRTHLINKTKIPVNKLLLVASFIVILIFHFFGYHGHYGFDDLHYAKLSHDFATGNFTLQDHFAYRWSIIFLTGLSYKLFGMSDHSSAIVSIIITFAILFLIYSVLRKQKPPIVFIGLSLYVFNYWTLFYADKLMTDIYIAFSVYSIFYLLYHQRFEAKKFHTVIYSLLISGALFFGFISKGTIVLILPVLGFLAIADFWKRKYQSFWITTSITTLLLFIGYFSIIGLITGNPFHRFEMMEKGSYLNAESYDLLPKIFLARRVSFQLIQNLIMEKMFLSFLFIIPAIITRNTRKIFKMDTPSSFFMVIALLLLLSSNFMTISISAYVPLGIDPRHYLFLIPIAATASASIIWKSITEKENLLIILALLFLCCILSWQLYFPSFEAYFIPVTVFFALVYIMPEENKDQVKALGYIVLCIALIIEPVILLFHPNADIYQTQKEIVHNNFIGSKEKAYVITDEVQIRMIDYYNSFDQNTSLKYLTYAEADTIEFEEGLNIYLLINPHAHQLSRIAYEDLPMYVKYVPDRYRKIIAKNKIELYRVNKILKRYHFGVEETKPEWKWKGQKIVEKDNHSGKRSIELKAWEYSPNFEIPIDDIPKEKTDSSSLLMSASLWYKQSGQGYPEMIVSIEKDTFEVIEKDTTYKKATIYWNNVRATDDSPSQKYWKKLLMEYTLPKGYHRGDRFRIYFLNNTTDKTLMDDFKLEFSSY